MRVKFLVETTVRLDSINSKIYPEGWAGEVPDQLGADVIQQGLAVYVEPTLTQLPPGQQFTAEQAAVLAAAADIALQQANQEQQGDGAGHAGDGSGTADAGDELQLEDLTKAELLELAEKAGLEGVKKLNKAELLEALTKPATE